MEVIKEISHIAGDRNSGSIGWDGYLQWVLPTSFVLVRDDPQLTEPSNFKIMRGAYGDLYQFPSGTMQHDVVPVPREALTYKELTSQPHFVDTKGLFRSTDLELWANYGHDGHFEYVHMSTWRVWASPEEIELTGAQISHVLEWEVAKFERTQQQRLDKERLERERNGEDE